MRAADHSGTSKDSLHPNTTTQQNRATTTKNSKRSTSRMHYSINIYWASTSEHFRTAKMGRLARGSWARNTQ